MYWKSRGSTGPDQTILQKRLIRDSGFLLTAGPPGGCNSLNSPDEKEQNILWDFLLVGDPNNCPFGWESYSELPNTFDEPKVSSDKDALLSSGHVSLVFRDAEWQQVSLPAHWQLQVGVKDIPIYTNTTYPIQFDPPRARRTGLWKNMDCDVGLGADTKPYNTASRRSD